MSAVTICGQAARSFETMGELWVINGPRYIDAADRLFQLHGIEHIRERHDDDYLETLAKFEGTLYTTRAWPELPNATVFPLDDITQFARLWYFNSSWCYAVALAVMEEHDHIVLDGIQFGDDWKENWSAPAIEYWVGFARGRGIRVDTPPGQLFYRAEYLYGFEGPGSI